MQLYFALCVPGGLGSLVTRYQSDMRSLPLVPTQDTSLEPRPGTPLPVVRDEAANPVPRTLLLQVGLRSVRGGCRRREGVLGFAGQVAGSEDVHDAAVCGAKIVR